MKRLTVQKILKRYTKPRQDSPDSFYSWRETQVMMENKYPFQNSYQFITHPDDLEIALRPFQRSRLLGIDCETTGIDPHIDRVRLLQLAIPHQPVLVIDLFSLPEIKQTPLRSLLTSNCLKVGHNLKRESRTLGGRRRVGGRKRSGMQCRSCSCGRMSLLLFMSVALSLSQLTPVFLRIYESFSR